MTERSNTVVVTGATSFVGMHLARRLAADGFRVVATISGPLETYTGIRARRLQALGPSISLAQLDLRDAHAITSLVDRLCPDLWLQHAGYATNYASADYDLASGFSTNVLPLKSLYAALSGSRCGVIITGSSTEYAPSHTANREEDACWPASPYGLSKLAETIMACHLAQRYAVPTRIARLYIPFGPLDNPDKLLAQTIEGLREGKPIPLSPCNQERDFIGISDLGNAFIALGRDLPRTGFDIFNICSGQPVQLRQFLLAIADRIGGARDLLQFGARPLREGEPAISYGSNEKAKQILGWAISPLTAAIDRDLLARGSQHSDLRDCLHANAETSGP